MNSTDFENDNTLKCAAIKLNNAAVILRNYISVAEYEDLIDESIRNGEKKLLQTKIHLTKINKKIEKKSSEELILRRDELMTKIDNVWRAVRSANFEKTTKVEFFKTLYYSDKGNTDRVNKEFIKLYKDKNAPTINKSKQIKSDKKNKKNTNKNKTVKNEDDNSPMDIITNTNFEEVDGASPFRVEGESSPRDLDLSRLINHYRTQIGYNQAGEVYSKLQKKDYFDEKSGENIQDIRTRIISELDNDILRFNNIKRQVFTAFNDNHAKQSEYLTKAIINIKNFILITRTENTRKHIIMEGYRMINNLISINDYPRLGNAIKYHEYESYFYNIIKSYENLLHNKCKQNFAPILLYYILIRESREVMIDALDRRFETMTKDLSNYLNNYSLKHFREIVDKGEVREYISADKALFGIFSETIDVNLCSSDIKDLFFSCLSEKLYTSSEIVPSRNLIKSNIQNFIASSPEINKLENMRKSILKSIIESKIDNNDFETYYNIINKKYSTELLNKHQQEVMFNNITLKIGKTISQHFDSLSQSFLPGARFFVKDNSYELFYDMYKEHINSSFNACTMELNNIYKEYTLCKNGYLRQDSENELYYLLKSVIKTSLKGSGNTFINSLVVRRAKNVIKDMPDYSMIFDKLSKKEDNDYVGNFLDKSFMGYTDLFANLIIVRKIFEVRQKQIMYKQNFEEYYSNIISSGVAPKSVKKGDILKDFYTFVDKIDVESRYCIKSSSSSSSSSLPSSKKPIPKAEGSSTNITAKSGSQYGKNAGILGNDDKIYKDHNLDFLVKSSYTKHEYGFINSAIKIIEICAPQNSNEISLTEGNQIKLYNYHLLAELYRYFYFMGIIEHYDNDSPSENFVFDHIVKTYGEESVLEMLSKIEMEENSKIEDGINRKKTREPTFVRVKNFTDKDYDSSQAVKEINCAIQANIGVLNNYLAEEMNKLIYIKRYGDKAQEKVNTFMGHRECENLIRYYTKYNEQWIINKEGITKSEQKKILNNVREKLRKETNKDQNKLSELDEKISQLANDIEKIIPERKAQIVGEINELEKNIPEEIFNSDMAMWINIYCNSILLQEKQLGLDEIEKDVFGLAEFFNAYLEEYLLSNKNKRGSYNCDNSQLEDSNINVWRGIDLITTSIDTIISLKGYMGDDEIYFMVRNYVNTLADGYYYKYIPMLPCIIARSYL